MDIAKNILSYPEKICRICLSETLNQIPLQNKIDDSRTLHEVLSFLTNLNINLNDVYPKQICNECYVALTSADQFKQRCIISDNYLKETILSAHKQSENETKHEIILSEMPELYQCVVCSKKFSNLIDLEYHVFNHSLEKNVVEKKGTGSLIQTGTDKQTKDFSLSKTETDSVKEENVVKNENEHDNIDFDAEISQGSADNNQENIGTDCEKNLNVTENLDDDKSNNLVIKLKCPNCSIVVPNLKVLTSHIKLHKTLNNKRDMKNLKIHKCNKCMRKFANESSLQNHLKKHDENSQLKFVCKSCKRDFKHQAHLDNHILQVHTRDRGFSCDCCNKNFTTLEALHVHKEVHNVDKKHQCNICKKSFFMLSSLTDHLRTHTGEKPYLCSTCGRGFTQKTNLEQHIRRHLGLKPFQCENCDKRFVSKGELVAHTRKHTGAHPFVCDDCGNGFTTSSSLVKHRRTHTGERPFSCDMCSMKFATSGTLKNHRRTHTGEKPYQCSFCEKAFVQRQDMVSHVRCHTGERPYVCTNCGQAFRKASALKVHLKIHGKERDLLQGIHVQV